MIILYGAYGTGNLGDDAILKSALELFGDECRVISYGKPFLKRNINYIDYYQFIQHPTSFLSKGDVLVFAGGGLFWAASHAEDMLNCARAARSVGCDVKVERIGTQGVEVAINAARELFLLCSSITVRDIHSANLLKQLGVTEKAVISRDFVLELKDLPKPSRSSSRVVIGINHSAAPFFHEEKHREKALNVYCEISKACETFADFVYIPHTRHFNVISENDIIYGEYFWQASRGRISNPSFPQTVEDLLKIYALVDGVMAWRYHALVIANIMEARAAFLGAGEGHKYSAFATENKLTWIDFDLPSIEVIQSGCRFVDQVRADKFKKIQALPLP